MARLYTAILGMLVVGIILIVQLAQGETGWLHWVGLGFIAIGLAALVVEMQKARRE